MYGKHHSEETKKKIGGKAKERFKDITNHPCYNPNLTDEEREKGRNYPEYREFINESLEFYDYTCQCCGKRGVKLNVHHINGYSWDKEHRIDLNNSVVLCENCHNEYHEIYGKKYNNDWKHFREFLYNKYLQTNDLYFITLIEEIDLRIIQLNKVS